MARKKRNDKTEVPMSAMIDVVFLLLVFFIVTKKPNIPEAHVAINLPAPTARTSDEPPPQLLDVHVLPGNRYLFMGRAPKSLDELEELFIDISISSQDTSVMIKVSPDATEGEFVNLLDRVAKAGLTNVNVNMLAE